MLAWFRQIDGANTTGEVLAVARDYLATWSPEELSRISPRCRPGRIRDESDLEELHAVLVDEYRREDLGAETRNALQLLTSFMVRASVRIAELRGASPSSEDPVPDPGRRADAVRRE